MKPYDDAAKEKLYQEFYNCLSNYYPAHHDPKYAQYQQEFLARFVREYVAEHEGEYQLYLEWKKECGL